MNKIYKTEKIVKKVLIEYEDSRSDDFILVYRVFKEINETIVIRELFCEVMINHLKYGLPSISTIVRCRRKIFKEHPELKPLRATKKREEQESNMINYAIDGYNPSFMKMIESYE